MAPAIWASLIQGVLTVMAALIAVLGVSRQIGNWRHEVPGRRRIEIAEACMVAALAQQRLVERYSVATRNFMYLSLRPQLAEKQMLEHEELVGFFESLADNLEQLGREVCKSLDKLEQVSDVAEVYFGAQIKGAFKKMQNAGRLVSDRYAEFSKASSPEERESISRLLNMPFDVGSQLPSQEDVSVALYRKALLSELGRPSHRSSFGEEITGRIWQRVSPRAWSALDKWLPKR